MSPLYFGSSEATKFYLGGSEAQGLYLGASQVWAPGGGGGTTTFKLNEFTGTGVTDTSVSSGLVFLPRLLISLREDVPGEPNVGWNGGLAASWYWQVTNSSPTLDGSVFRSWDADNVKLGNSTRVNTVNGAYKQLIFAGNATSSTDNNGTIQSAIWTTPGTGFAMAEYTGNGTAGATVGHGCGVTPDLVLIKGQTVGESNNGRMWVPSLDVGGLFGFQDSFTTSTIHPSAADANVITQGSFVWQDYNKSGVNYFMFSFYSVAGISKVGTLSAAGTGVENIDCGFTPSMVMTRRTDAAGAWRVHYGATSGYMPYIQWGGGYSGGTSTSLQATANGFSIDSSAEGNDGTSTILYMAYA